jgi:hypothetical protein
MVDHYEIVSTSDGATRASSTTQVGGGWTVMLDDHGYLNHACVVYFTVDAPDAPRYTECTAGY